MSYLKGWDGRELKEYLIKVLYSFETGIPMSSEFADSKKDDTMRVTKHEPEYGLRYNSPLNKE